MPKIPAPDASDDSDEEYWDEAAGDLDNDSDDFDPGDDDTSTDEDTDDDDQT